MAWVDPALEVLCCQPARLRAAVGSQAAAAQDLLVLLAHVPRLHHLLTFKSVQTNVGPAGLTFSLEHVELHAQPLNIDWVQGDEVTATQRRRYLQTHAPVIQDLLIQDLHIRGRSILRHAS